ncbi:MAG: L,D-transpeptidase family protein, partial [Desulfovibrio sp.]|nr:L,D-transpeptidase family protein [Desulfovibrio sp.]
MPLKFFVKISLLCLAWLLQMQPSFADNWHTTFQDVALPKHFVAVDKERQKFFFFEKNSPLRLTYEFPCTTGQISGDKQVINDLKTPEGIYFVEYKIANGLDFKEYGGVAYTLNYPNPVDKLRGKTGHGIWIHSKGYGLVPTKGCVAIGLKDIDTVGPRLTPGTAVILAEGMQLSNKTPNAKTAKQLRQLMQSWTESWSNRSQHFFDFYNPEAYSKATQDFNAFRTNKERIFKLVQSIQLYNRDIHVLEGPGYWVTWAEQFYNASNHTTEGIRRLYWQQDANKNFRIVGMEWTPKEMGMRADFKNGKLVAQAQTKISDANPEAPSMPPLVMPENPINTESKIVALNDSLVPHTPHNAKIPSEFNWQSNTSTLVPDQALDENQKTEPREEPTTVVTKNAQRFMDLVLSQNPEVFDLFNKEQFNRVRGVLKQRTLNRILDELKTQENLPWLLGVYG